jgi:NADH:ubiquinone oxidoreductase subunit 4 (subunit M)
MFLSASYSIWFFNRISFGTLSIIYIKQYQDLNFREFLVLFLLTLSVIIIGLIPNIILDISYISVKMLLITSKNLI